MRGLHAEGVGHKLDEGSSGCLMIGEGGQGLGFGQGSPTLAHIHTVAQLSPVGCDEYIVVPHPQRQAALCKHLLEGAYQLQGEVLLRRRG